MHYYDPLDKEYKSLIGAVQRKKEIKFRVKGDFDSVFFVCGKDGGDKTYTPMEKKDGFFEFSTAFNETGLYFYCFSADGRTILSDDRGYGVLDHGKEFELTVFSEEYSLPKWLYGGVIYQIFPDRFYSSGEKRKLARGRVLHKDETEMPNYLPNADGEVLNNDFYGGDLKGIEEKIPYLKSLGVTAIYLNPIFKAYSNHRYDTGDYLEIDPLLGDENDLKSLIAECEKNGIGIILDGVFNHTGSNSRYFNKDREYDSFGAYEGKDSPYYEWYKFIDYPNEYESWWGIKTLPAVNKESKSYKDFITGKGGVIEKYLKLGIKGWRLDVVDELPAHFVRDIRKAVKGVDADALVLGEVWEDASDKISYGVRREYFLGRELDSVMNYPFKDAIVDFLLFGDAKAFSGVLRTLNDHYPKDVLDLCMNILSTHDTARIFSVLSGRDYKGLSKREKAEIVLSEKEVHLAKKRMKLASVLLFTFPGVPSIYYGDEIGMQGFFDPYNRAFYTWGNIERSLLSHYKKLGEIRKNYSQFSGGEFSEVYVGKSVYAFSRSNDDGEILTVINAGNEPAEMEFAGKLFDVLEEKEYSNSLSLEPLSAYMFVKADD